MDDNKKSNRYYLMSEISPRDRPRERLLSRGSEALSDVELIAIILRSGPQGKSTIDLARELLSRYNGDLNALAAAEPVELLKIKGIGKVKAAELKATFSLASRLASEIMLEKRKIESPDDAADYFREIFRGKRQEEMRILMLNTKNNIIKDELITIGLLDSSQVHPREIFRAAIQNSAAKIILAHNHPSGDPSPSNQDILCTKRLVQASQVIGVEITDHIIVGSNLANKAEDYFSFKENELLAVCRTLSDKLV